MTHGPGPQALQIRALRPSVAEFGIDVETAQLAT
jgi:hypothetical protein